MNDTEHFHEILSRIEEKDEQCLLDALRELNTHNSIQCPSFPDTPVPFIYIGEDNSFLLVKFDFLKDNREAWLADEEKFNGEAPLYFSPHSHRTSPVYEILVTKDFFSKLFPNSDIYMLLVCNYTILNYEDMESLWREMGVKVVHQIKDTTHQEFNPGLPPLPSENISKKEFREALEEFIKGQSGDDEGTSIPEEPFEEESPEILMENEEEEPEEEEISDIPPGCFDIYELKLLRGTYGEDSEEDIDAMPSLRSFDVHGLKSVCLHLHLVYVRGKVLDEYLEINLYNELGQLLKHDLTQARFVPIDREWEVFCFYNIEEDEHFSWTKGSYLIEVKYHNTLITPVRFDVQNKDVKGVFSQSFKAADEMSAHPFDSLNRLVGLAQVKEQMAAYRDLVSLSTQRKSSSLPASQPPLHAVFMGNPGTGKTTVARLYGAMLRELGLLTSGHVVFKERSSLTGPNYSSEQEKTLEAIDEAEGGVLFIDEAYTLYKPNDPRDPGKFVIETLLTALSDERKRNWALLLAGYTNDMTAMLNMNPGLSSRIPERNRYHFKDYTVDELMQIADCYCENNSYILTPDARKALQLKVKSDYRRRDEKFGNARYITTLFDTEVLQAMATRVARLQKPSLLQLVSIEKEDIPTVHLKDYRTPLKKLQNMVGLGELKKSIESHLNMVKLQMQRNELGIGTALPPLHMVFAGNPGTGKTTVASFIGEIYASLGLLSTGHVVYAERKDLIGQYIGDTEAKTAEVLKRAQGNVLFIDEAYTLTANSSKNDFGPRVLEVLLSTLGKEDVDMLVILAGYPEEMEAMLQSNPGLKSRIPYTFHFADYTAEELMQIADKVVEKSNYSFSPAARRDLQKLVEAKLANKDIHWGNARFITRLISAHILPAMSNRLAALPSSKQKNKRNLSLICREDIPHPDHTPLQESLPARFDEAAIKRVLKKLDALTGLEHVKRSIHNFVKVARYMHEQGSSYTENEPLRWNFTGNTGTGKSTVAAIMGELLKAMNLLEKGHMVEIKAEEMYSAPAGKGDELLYNAMIRSQHGLLFIDGDATSFKHLDDSSFNGESLRFKLSTMTMELPGAYALIIAENEGKRHNLSRNLRARGVSSFNHTLHFADYTEVELLDILKSCLKRKRLNLTEGASAHMAEYIHSLAVHYDLGYANARTMSLLARSIAETYVLRVSEKGEADDKQVLLADVEVFVWQEGLGGKRIGYM